MNITLGATAISQCLAIDINDDGQAMINELIAAVNAALSGCAGTPTHTATATLSPPTHTATATLGPPTPVATDTQTAQPSTITATATPSPVATASDTPSRSQTPSRTPTPTRTISTVTPIDLPADRVRIESFTAENGTQYFVVGVEGEVAAGAQITSLAVGRQPLSLAELGAGSLLRRSAVTREELGDLLAMGRLVRTSVVRGLPATQIQLDPRREANDGDFDPCANGGAGLLYLPGGERTVSLGAGAADEPLHQVTVASGAGDEFVPAAIRKRIRRRMSRVRLEGPTLVFPVPGPAYCAGTDTECTDDDQCGPCNQVGQGCCGRASDPPTCSATGLIVCDSLDNSSTQCNFEGSCEPGGAAANQNITLDADIGAVVGNPASQPERPDGFFLRTNEDVVVFIVAPSGPRQHFTATAAGFLVEDSPPGERRVLGATAERSIVVGAGSTGCGTPLATSTAVLSDTPGTPTIAIPTPAIRERVLARLHRFPMQTFESADGYVYTVLASNPGERGIGVQVTSLAATSDSSVAQLAEAAGFDPGDPILTSVAAVRNGTAVSFSRTALISGLPSSFIEDELNPINGVFDPDGSGLLTLPGGTRTVGAFGRGTEPLIGLAESSGSTANAFVPPARLASVSRRLGLEALFEAPTYVFPFFFGPPTTSRGTTCVGGVRDGEVCNPQDPIPGDCFEGFGCIEQGGEAPGQNVTLDDALNSRIGNPGAQNVFTDGFLLADTSQLIVFVTSPMPASGRLDVAASGFRVTGSCSSPSPISCSHDDECAGGICSPELPARTVVSAATSDPVGGLTVQSFVSDLGRVYLVVSSVPGRSSAFGTQVTSLSFGIGQLTQFAEESLRHNDVLTSFSAGKSQIALSALHRTGMITGLPSAFIQDMGNPVNGVFDPSAIGGTGLLTLPGGQRTVAAENTGTEPIVNISFSTGVGGITFVPAAATTTLTRAVDLNRFTEVPTVVFPNPPGPVVTSAPTTCTREDGIGPVCDPDKGNLDCRSGGMCTTPGGETAGQNATIDDTVDSRIGNPDSQGSSVDGFFLPSDDTTLIVFLIDGLGLAGPLSFSVSGYTVTGTCSNADTPCLIDSDCPGGVCRDGLSQRNVVAATGYLQ